MNSETVNWLLKIGAVLGAFLFLSLCIRKILSTFHAKILESGKIPLRKIDQIFYLPLQTAIWGLALIYFLEQLGIVGLVAIVHRWRASWIVACIFWIALRWVKEVFISFVKLKSSSANGVHITYLLEKLISFALVLSGILTILSIFRIPIGPFVTFGGVGAAACAFAAKDIIANFFGGIMIFFSDVFSIGDKVVFPALENFEGVITDIGWYRTVAEDYYRRPVYFPNSLFSKARVINETRRSHRRIKGTLTLRYQDLPLVEKIVSEMRDRIGAHPKIDKTQSFSIQLSDLNKTGVEIFYYILSSEIVFDRFALVKQEVYVIMNEVILKHGAQMAYQTYNVRVKA